MIMNSVETDKCFKKGHDLSIKGLYTSKKGIDECRMCRLDSHNKWKNKNLNLARSVGEQHRSTKRFGGNREAAIQRDNEQCVMCGMTRMEHKERYGRDITVDHIDGLGRYTADDSQNNKLENLQTLCLYCHGKKDSKRRGKKNEHIKQAS